MDAPHIPSSPSEVTESWLRVLLCHINGLSSEDDLAKVLRLETQFPGDHGGVLSTVCRVFAHLEIRYSLNNRD